MNSGAANTTTPRISLLTATCIVVANMIGTGVFTSLGFQVGDLPSGFAIIALWLIGGLCALCGALSYAELATALPRSGGEYHFLTEVYHPAVGFLAGWISITVGFAAPVAIAAMPFGTYLAELFPGTNPLFAALAVVWLTTLVLLLDLRLGSAFQMGATFLKVALIVAIIIAGLLVGQTTSLSFAPTRNDLGLIASGPFAISLFWVMYAYSGWNASTYITGELRNPTRSILLSVGIGTLVVTILYVLLNGVFLRTTPIPELVGKQQVAMAAGAHIFGSGGGRVTAGLICAGLVSTVSAMMWIGPRVAATMGEDYRIFAWWRMRTSRGVPAAAMLAQFVIVNVMLLVASFQAVVNYVQFSLTLCSALTVFGVYVLRWRQPDLLRPYRVIGYPLTPAIFLAISGWMLWHLLADAKTRGPSLLGAATIAFGLVFYFVSPKDTRLQTV